MTSAPIFVLVDDKHIPVYRIMWVSDVPHFCGNEDCQCEGDYEVRLEQDESIWASRIERDEVLMEALGPLRRTAYLAVKRSEVSSFAAHDAAYECVQHALTF